MKKIILSLLSVGVFSCGDKDAGPVPVLDVTQKSYPQKEIVLQDIATVEYIPLEMKDGFLLAQYPQIHYIDDDIIVANDWFGTPGPIMFFDRKTGKAINSFDRRGRGPGEYISVGSIAVDTKAGEIFVTEGMITVGRTRTPMYVYDMQGKHLRTLDIPREGHKDYFHVYDDDHLFCYNEDVEDSEPYKLISRTDTSVTYLPVEFPARDYRSGNSDRDNEIEKAVYSGTTVLKTREGYIFAEPGVDTLYGWNKQSSVLTPLVALTPAFNSMDIPVSIYIEGQSDDYLFLEIEECKERMPHERVYDFSELVYDKNDGQFYESEIVNRDYVEYGYVYISNTSSSSVAYPPGVFVNVIQAVRLVDLHEKGKLRGPLAEVASKLKEDDNPVLMIATFK